MGVVELPKTLTGLPASGLPCHNSVRDFCAAANPVDSLAPKGNLKMTHRTSTARWTALFAAVMMAPVAPAVAQPVPWDAFADTQSTSVCDVINAANAELVLLTATQQLVIVSGEDVTLIDTFVDLDGFVFFEGLPTGLIDFALDDDGLRTLWWTDLLGRAVEVNGFTGVPTISNLSPGDFANVACDACPFWDDPSVCVVPDEPDVVDDAPTVTFNICGTNFPITLGMIATGLMFMGLTRRRFVR